MKFAIIGNRNNIQILQVCPFPYLRLRGIISNEKKINIINRFFLFFLLLVICTVLSQICDNVIIQFLIVYVLFNNFFQL